MFSADYPYAAMAQARVFLDQLPVSTADRERIAHGNAERLFGLSKIATEWHVAGHFVPEM